MKNLESWSVRTAELLRIAACPARLKLLRTLFHSPHNVGDLVAAVGLPAGCGQSAISAHLTKLRYAGLVEAERRGRNVFYALTALGRQVLVLSVTLDVDSAA